MKVNLQHAKDIIRSTQLAYIKMFSTLEPEKLIVLNDLKRFCRIDRSTFHPDARVHAALEGRREVSQRILDFTTLTTEELEKRYIREEKDNE